MKKIILILTVVGIMLNFLIYKKKIFLFILGFILLVIFLARMAETHPQAFWVKVLYKRRKFWKKKKGK
jgi:hypothetical protein